MTDDDGESEPSAPFDGVVERYRWTESGRPSMALVDAVADATDREPTEIAPLQHCVDTDALDALFDGSLDTDLHVTFEYDGVYVVVESNGVIEIRRPVTDG
ncbi:MAG: HalOD1 output domain-containing protein [Haloplanus sp.]